MSEVPQWSPLPAPRVGHRPCQSRVNDLVNFPVYRVKVLGNSHSDFYGAYNVYQGPHQRCWTHLLRDIHQLKEQHPQDLVLAKWAHAVREVYDHAQACPEPDPNLPETVQRARR